MKDETADLRENSNHDSSRSLGPEILQNPVDAFTAAEVAALRFWDGRFVFGLTSYSCNCPE